MELQTSTWTALGSLLLGLAAGTTASAEVPAQDLYAYSVGDTVEVRWTTPVPTKCYVAYGAKGALNRRAAEDPSCLRGSTNAGRGSGIGYANNHRATVKRVRTWPVYVRIVGKSAKGQPVKSKVVKVEKAAPPQVTLPPGQVKIHIDRGAWKDPEPPITVGVPMPKGALADVKHLSLLHNEKPIPFQASVVTRYLDGRTVKWLRVTFLAPKDAKSVMLAYGKATAWPGTKLTVKRSQKTAIIETGAAKLTFRGGYGDLRTGETVLRLPAAVLVDGKGKTFRSRVETLSVEEQGPVMIVLRINGHHVGAGKQKRFVFEQRIYAYAGKPYVRLDYTFGNDLVGPPAAQSSWTKKMPKMDSIRSLRLQFSGAATATVDVGTGTQRCALAPGQRVFQREDSQWLQEPGKAKGKRMEGVVRVGKARVLLKNFWEEWPKSVARDRTAVHVGLCPKLPTTWPRRTSFTSTCPARPRPRA